jgi:ABC-type antimicrobial peptide transport system permease subunit
VEEPKKISPPAWATKLLAWYCKAELLEDLQGDLNEYFDRNVKSHGVRKARLIYIIDVVKFFRLYTIRKPEFINLLISWIMIGSYIKTSGRSIVRNKLFSAINIIGLAVSMSVGLVLIAILSDILSYDKFHANYDRIQRVICRYEYLGDKGNNFMATTSLKAARLIKEEFTGIEEVAILHRGFDGDIKQVEKIIPLKGFWANESFFKVFSFELLKGDAATALKQPFSMVITETAAKKLFGNEEAFGKAVIFNNDKSYTITGIIKDIPFFSHIQFEMLGSLSTREIITKGDDDETAWDNVWSTWVYLVLPNGGDTQLLKSNLAALSLREDPSVKNTHVEFDLQPISAIMFKDSLGNQLGPVLGSTLLWVFGGLCFVVILSACFNYTNLSIARSLKRTREVGIRKVIGALKSNVATQFMVEAVIISISALAIALLVFFVLRPHFLSIEPDLHKMFTLHLSPNIIIYFFGFAIFIGVAAGLFPSLFFSNINAIQVLKSTSPLRGMNRLTGRKILIVTQYCISIILVSASIGVYRQYQHYISFDLGFNTENVLNVTLQGNKAELLKKEINELPEVKGVSQSLLVTSVGNYWGTNMKYHGTPNDSCGVSYNSIDENYIPLMGHQLIAGKNFSVKPDSVEESEVIVNMQVLKRFNIANQDPQKAIGDVLKVDRKNLTIIGVMKDFQYGRSNNKTSKETVFRYLDRKANIMNIKIQSNDLIGTHAKIKSIWKKIDPVHPFEAKFYNEQIEEAFAGLRATLKLAGFLAFLAISIASLGLLGMVVFTTEIRLKEVSIRKVMGASEVKLLYLLGKGFVLLLLISAAISLPIVILFFQNVVFPNTANHAPLNLLEMLLGVFVILLFALVLIGTQTLKVARTNPAEVLKNE